MTMIHFTNILLLQVQKATVFTMTFTFSFALRERHPKWFLTCQTEEKFNAADRNYTPAHIMHTT